MQSPTFSEVLHFTPYTLHFLPLCSTNLVYNTTLCIARTFYHFYDFVSKKSSKPMQIASLVFFVVYILAKNIAPQRIHINNYLTQILVYTLAAFSLWNVADIFIERIRPRAIYRRSFVIYAMHLNVAIVILKIFI